ncbi:MAG: thymidylate kinase [Ruminococcaceae bacterium]|nr:thymidylate kinase [Oscillospiraceae bacterium]
MKGKLIVIEGLDGSGKSTQINLLAEEVKRRGLQYKQIKLPNYDGDSSALVKMYLAGTFGKNPEDVNAYAASAFYAVDRFASFKTIWKDDYEKGSVILADRYTTSNAYHQMIKQPRENWDAYIEWLEDFEYNKIGIPKPDLVIYLDMPVEISQKLMTSRYEGNESKKDVHEANVAYLNACREAAAYASEKMGWVRIACSDGDNARSIEAIAEDIRTSIERIL